ncbi:hypothetical protein [Pseudodesulfovibrio indicus]|uniref:hypothetical protein n=1 Tax=Pseudodesulfovibrio indicus TaxID=1716143 RepID=UPI00130EB0EA|nr:hypothetical protein [Pseudodesulfovibrio indicus]
MRPPEPYLAQKTLDPIRGPYTVEEFEGLRSAIHKAYENCKIGDEYYIILILVNVFGLRPKQIAVLKICDFLISATEAGGIEYSLNVPRVKQRDVGERTAFTNRKLGSEIGEYLNLWIDELKNEISFRGIKLKYDEGLFPLFPLWKPRKKEINIKSQGDYEYHSGNDRIAQIACSQIRRAISEKSHRTGENLAVGSRRARHYIGTTMAVNGCGRRVIAHALDHSHLHSCKAYIQFGQEAIDEIDKKLAPHQKPLIDAFRGRLIEKPNLFGTRQTYNPVRSSLNTEELGMCVNPSGCAIYSIDIGEPSSFLARVPFSCYRCWNFNAFNNLEVHKEHLEILKREKQLSLKSFNEEGLNTQPGLAVSYAPMIRAVEDVIAKIEAGDISEFDLETDMVDSF